MPANKSFISRVFGNDTAPNCDGTFYEVCRSETRRTGNVNRKVRADAPPRWDETHDSGTKRESRALPNRGRPNSDLVRRHVRDLTVGRQRGQRDLVRARREHVSRDERRDHRTTLHC